MSFPHWDPDRVLQRQLRSYTFHSPTLPGALRKAADWIETNVHHVDIAGPHVYALQTEESTLGTFVSVIVYGGGEQG